MAAGGLFLSISVAIVWWLQPPSEAQQVLRLRQAMEQRHADIAEKRAIELELSRPRTVEAWRLLARQAEQSSDVQRQRHALTKLVELEPGRAPLHWTRFASLEMQHNHALAAEAALARALAIDPNLIDGLRLQSQLLGVTGRSQELATCLLRLVRLKAFNTTDLVILAAVDPFVADPDRLAALEHAEPDNPGPLLARSRIALNADHTAEAEQLLQKLVSRQPQNWEAQGLLGNLLGDRSDVEFLQWQQSLPPGADQSSRIWLARGLWLQRRGELEPAARCFHEAVSREPELVPAMTQLGQALRLRGEAAASAEYANRSKLLQEIRDLATRIDEQKNLRWAPALIAALEQCGRIWEAWAWCSVALQAQPANPDIRRRMDRLGKLLSPDLPRTLPDSMPGRQLDWSLVTLPDWSRYQAATVAERAPATDSSIHLEDETQRTGLNFTFASSDDPKTPGRFIFESTGGGVAAIDYDQDGWPDLYFPQAGPWPVQPDQAPPDQLFRNQGGERFEDVTAHCGVYERSYGQGIAAGDFDNDGFPDLYVANIGINRLFRNNGDGTFTDVTVAAGITDSQWTISAAIADLNGDSLPDLFDVNYVDGAEAFTTVCLDGQQQPRVCRPTIFEPALDLVLLNRGDGTFERQQQEAGLDVPHGRGMGLVVADLDLDHRLDVFVANDQSPNHLFLNETPDGSPGLKLKEQGLVLGAALSREGQALAFMGIAADDVNRDGRPDLFVTTFAQETNVLFLSQPDGQFADSTREAGLRTPSFEMLGFGTQFVDLDNDGWLDLLVLNGHIDEFSFQGQAYRMRAQCFRGLPGGRFVELPPGAAGEFFHRERLGRGLALLDWNRDGRMECAASDLEQNATLLTNQSAGSAKTLLLKCIGVQSARDAVGAKVEVTVETGEVRHLQIMAGNGFECSNQAILHIGVGTAEAVQSLRIRWPSGTQSTFHEIPANRHWLIIEGTSAPVEILGTSLETVPKT